MPPNQSRRLSCAGCALIALSAAYLAAVAALMLAQRYFGERVWFVTWLTYAPQHAAAIPGPCFCGPFWRAAHARCC